MLRVLTFSTLYPNRITPSHGIFVENRLREVIGTGEVEARVVAPVPWAPWGTQFLDSYAGFRKVPASDLRNGIQLFHPRYFLIPKVGMTLAPATMYASLRGFVRRIIEEGYDFDLIDAHYFYPDGVAAVMLGKYLSKPVVITARGTDLNLIPSYALPRRQIMWAAQHAHGLITVCQALKDILVDMGVPDSKVRTLRNGVDLDRFHPADRDQCRAELGVKGRVMLSVGHLIPRKGHDLVIRAMPSLPDCSLLVAGDGPERQQLERLSVELGVAERVRFLGSVAPGDMARLYNAGDVLVLASSREGWANVLLEAMACGTPVVASNVWGTPEVVADAAAGRLMHERSPEGVVQGVKALFGALPDRMDTRAYAADFGWEPTTRGQVELFTNIVNTA